MKKLALGGIGLASALTLFAGTLVADGGLAKAADATVEMQADATAGGKFTPASVTVNVGDTVTWKQVDALPHSAKSDTGVWDTGLLTTNGATASHTFTEAGTFPYTCLVHPAMKGTVVVQAVQATATTPAATATTPAATATTPAATATTPAPTATPTATTPAATATTPAATTAATTPAAPATGSDTVGGSDSKTGLYLGIITLAAMLAIGSGVAIRSRGKS